MPRRSSPTPGGTWCSPASRSSSRCWPSTSLATRCRTPSTPARRNLDPSMRTPEKIPQEKGISMRTKVAWVVMPGLIAALAFALSSCGGSSSSSSSSDVSSEVSKYPPPTAPPDNAQQGGTLNVLAPDDVENPTPDLADGEPTISSDNKTLTFKIKSGIKYSPPLGGGAAPKGDVT